MLNGILAANHADSLKYQRYKYLDKIIKDITIVVRFVFKSDLLRRMFPNVTNTSPTITSIR